MTLTLDFQGQIKNSHILGMGRSIDLEWKRCELDTMLDAQWTSSWTTVHGKSVSNLLADEWAIRSLMRGWGVFSFSECLVLLMLTFCSKCSVI